MIDQNYKKQTPGGASIRSLGERHKEKITNHLISLSEHDRYLRFGYIAADEQIARYVNGIDCEHDDIFGIFNRKLQIIAMAHLAYSIDKSFESCAEFGVSVSVKVRGRGFGSMLFERAITHARNQGVHMMFIHALTENEAMLKIARKAGAVIERAGSETEAYLRLPSASFESQISEMVEEKIAQIDYQMKVKAKQFMDFIFKAKNSSDKIKKTGAM